MGLQIGHARTFKDNYVWLLRDEASGVIAAVDPGQSAPVISELERRGWTLDWILNTHHHWDHTSGNRALKKRFGCRIAGSARDRDRIPEVDHLLDEGDVLELGESKANILLTPGHTRAHICYWFAKDKALFSGDTLFLMGCGVLAEGDAPILWASLSRLATLPQETLVYCAHEYTEANGRFAATIEPHNDGVSRRMEWVRERRARREPTVPATLAQELLTNPFLRAGDPEIAAVIGMPSAAAADVFGELRRLKDRFAA